MTDFASLTKCILLMLISKFISNSELHAKHVFEMVIYFPPNLAAFIFELQITTSMTKWITRSIYFSIDANCT